MSDQHIDPAGNTQQFRAFAQQNEHEAKPKRSAALPIIAGVVVLAIIAVVAYLLLR
ncbi:hypothetical protein [Nonomuraea typhae]|uniref:Uncharacterized protein n=1 Tax=Nonomuraea typhae TaxID=2603600 RepID=A0ABW7Z0N9_9ACTN|nr:hypothetical protein [Nonomuraea typhae]